MSLAAGVISLYGLFSMVGGFLGYVKARSRASLIAGTSSGLLLWVCAYGLNRGHRAAAIGGFLIALALGGRFLGTWRRTRRVMPDLAMVGGSVATLVAVGWWWVAR